MVDERLTDEQVAQLVGLGPCFSHYHTDQQTTTLNELLPDQTGQEGKALVSRSGEAVWESVGGGSSVPNWIQSFAARHG